MDLVLPWKKKPNDKNCDFTLIIGDRPIGVHRKVLRKETLYFDENFPVNLDTTCETYNVQNTSHAAVHACVRFIYKRKFTPNMEIIEDVFNLSRTWRLKNLKKICNDFLKNSMNDMQCVVIKKLSQKLEDLKLEHECDEYLLTHLDSIVNYDNICHLSITEVSMICSDYVGPTTGFGIPDLEAKDSVLWKLITKWVDYDIDKREEQLCKMIQTASFTYFDVTLVEKHILENPHVKNCEKCKIYVEERLLEVLEHKLSFDKEIQNLGIIEQICTSEEMDFVLLLAGKYNKQNLEMGVNSCLQKNSENNVNHSNENLDFSKSEMCEFIQETQF
ncbi:kelch-like protein 7 [Styela clava]